MRALELEPEMEAFFARLAPEAMDAWQGATEKEIGQIEQLAGRQLPRFYRWFLMRMGRSMGPIAYETLDFSAQKVLACYADGLFRPSSRFLMIGHESAEVMPLHVLYDFDHLARDDARVTKRHAMGGAIHNQFETFREMLAWGKCLTYCINTFPVRCIGLLQDSGGDVLSRLDPLMKSLNFASPIPTGPCCSIYLRDDAGMVTSSTPGDPAEFHYFHLGGWDAQRLRRILGFIQTETSIELEVEKWEPDRG